MAKRLSLKENEFCRLYSSSEEHFGNGVRAYAKAYDIDITTKKGYNTAKAGAYRALTKDYILAKINKLLDATINEQFVDKQLAFLVTQNADLHVKLGAIKEYNALKQRIVKRTNVSGELTINLKETKTYGGNKL